MDKNDTTIQYEILFAELLRSKKNELDKKKEDLEKEQEEIGAIEFLMQVVRQQADQIEQLKQQLDNKDEELAKKDEQLEKMRTQLAKKDEQIEQLDNAQEALKSENMQLKMEQKELGKISQTLIKKSEQEVVIRILRIYMNTSKRKNVKKRGYIKMVILEMAQSAHVTLPDDMQEELEYFDDDNIDRTVNYNFNSAVGQAIGHVGTLTSNNGTDD